MSQFVRTNLFVYLGVALLAFGNSDAGGAVINVFGDDADARIEDDSGNNSTRDGLGSKVANAGNNNNRIGSFNTDRNIAVVVPFLMPTIPTGEAISAASVSLFLESQNGNPSGYDVELTLLDRTSSTSTVLTTDFEGTGLVLDSAFLEAGDPVNQYYTHTSLSLATELGTRTPLEYVFFRFKPTDNANNYASNRGWTVTMSNNPGTTQDPTLSITTAPQAVIPEPSTYAVFGGLALCFGLAGWWRQRRQAA